MIGDSKGEMSKESKRVKKDSGFRDIIKYIREMKNKEYNMIDRINKYTVTGYLSILSTSICTQIHTPIVNRKS